MLPNRLKKGKKGQKRFARLDENLIDLQWFGVENRDLHSDSADEAVTLQGTDLL